MTAFLTLVAIYREHYRPWLDVDCECPEAVLETTPHEERNTTS
jgi:hypothetical protein